jgi:hypothetical protein
MSEIKHEKEEAFIKELNELIKRHGLMVREEQGESFIYDFIYHRTGSDVIFNPLADEYIKVGEKHKPFWMNLMRGNL